MLKRSAHSVVEAQRGGAHGIGHHAPFAQPNFAQRAEIQQLLFALRLSVDAVAARAGAVIDVAPVMRG